MRISRNFDADELTVSEHHPELASNFDELPTGAVVNLLRVVYRFLQPLRDVVGEVAIGSGYRGPALNEAVGGAGNSRHTAGLAADFCATSVSAPEVFALLAAGQTHATFDRLCLYPRSNRLHVDLAPIDAGIPRRLFFVDHGSGWQPIDEADAARITE